MFITPPETSTSASLYSCVQNLQICRKTLSQSCLLLAAVSKIEGALADKLPKLESQGGIWFLAETERDIFLWRHGLSIKERIQFEFWIDIARLVDKRLTQLTLMGLDNPFFGGCDEREYLLAFLREFSRIAKYIHALNQAISVVTAEKYQEKPIILLPCKHTNAL